MGPVIKKDLPGTAAPQGRSALQLLLDEGHKETLAAKLAAPDDNLKNTLNARDENGRALLHDLALRGWADLIPAAVAAGADITLQDRDGLTALHLAAATGQTDSARMLIQLGTPVDTAAADMAETPLHIAIEYGQYDMVAALLRADACPAARNPKGDVDGKNAYHYAAVSTPQIMELLLQHPDVAHMHDRHASGTMQGDAFRLALKAANMPVVNLLMDYGVAMNGKDTEGLTPLTWLLTHRDTKKEALPFIQLLLQNGADGDKAVNQWGETPLMLAAKSDFADAVQLLLDQGADPKRSNHFDETALHFAVLHYTTATVTALLDAGADVNAQDRTGQTPLHIAAHRNRRDVVRILLDADADPMIKDKRGRRPDELCQAPVQQNTRRMVLERQQLRQKRGKAKTQFRRSNGHNRFTQNKKPPFKGYRNRP